MVYTGYTRWYTAMEYPTISVIIPTFNSEKTLPTTLESLKAQTYPKDKIEILIIDGGSKDKTLAIAKQFSCTVIPNPKTELIYGKHIGYLKATGKYLLFIDSDESLESKHSLEIKINTFLKNNQVKIVVPTGYKSPVNVSPINDYINEFGDPFSFFIYRESKGYNFLINEFKHRFNVIAEDTDRVIFDFSNTTRLPLIEVWAGGCMIEKKYFKSTVPQADTDNTLLSHLFYFLVEKKHYIGITQNDPTIHYSSESVRKYLKKLGSRVKNNIFMTSMGKGGFEGRNVLHKNAYPFKKYLFLPYALSVILPLADGIYLAITRRQPFYFLHPFLCLYTCYLILYFYIIKIVKITPTINTYGR